MMIRDLDMQAVLASEFGSSRSNIDRSNGLLASASGSNPRNLGAAPQSEPTRTSAYLHAGQIVVSAEPCTITTIVGSCVAVFLFDPVLRAGGGNHYVLPMTGRSDGPAARYGDAAIAELLRRVAALGCRQEDLQAKVIGGASIIQASEHIGAESLGMKNVKLARQILGEHRICILAEDIGGTRGRRVLFRTDSGDVFVRKL